MKSYMRLALVPALAALAACSGSPLPTSTVGPGEPSATAASPTATPAPSSDRLAGSFDIGDGQKLYLQCAGSGTPTILLEAGDGDPGPDHWREVIPGLTAESRTCTYDRLGVGKSSDATGCRQLDDILDDLDALLGAAGLEGPYVLVGASGGGFLMAGFAARHPVDVAGMVFVETPKALTGELYPDVLPQIACGAPGNSEHRDFYAVEHAAWDHRARVGDFALTVISNDYGDTVEPNTDEATNVEDQRGWFVLSPDSASQIVVTSGHNVASNAPALVIREILKVLEAARGAEAAG